MSMLPKATLRRLSQLKRLNSVWEGARRPLPRKTYSYNDSPNVLHLPQEDREALPECILWVDGSMGMVRAMDVVEADVGNDAFARALIQAMERPQGPAQPALPQKILVCDRELQFYLRGILQGLDITVEYADTLPLINEIFTNMLEHTTPPLPMIPPSMANQLLQQSAQLWRNAPWKQLMDHQVIAIELNCCDLERLFAVVMGKLGLEEGVLFYRSYASLAQFRQRLGADEDNEVLMEETFLGQDCLFNLFESAEDMAEPDMRFLQIHGWTNEDVYPIFGSLHPLEGGRPNLYEEEAQALIIAISALNQFYKQHSRKFRGDQFPECCGVYTVESVQGTHQITVQTMPELAKELSEMTASEEKKESKILHDLLPDGTLIKLTETPWSIQEVLRSLPHAQCSAEPLPKQGKGVPNLLLQTSRPKATQLIKDIADRDGIRGVCFAPGVAPFGEKCEVLLLVMGNGEMQIITDFSVPNSYDARISKQWQTRCADMHDRCLVTIAMGVNKSRGNPEPAHFLAYYEVTKISPDDLGLELLQAEMSFDF